MGAFNFTAIDFETANHKRHSACAVGMVRVEDGRIVDTLDLLIRPPELYFEFTRIHGITRDDVLHCQTFEQLWPNMEKFIASSQFMVAHNAPFDRSVLNASCKYYGITPMDIDFKCTVQIARHVLGIRPARLSNVCRVLGIDLDHHQALSDAVASAKIFIHALSCKGMSLLR